jgi:hypothetical protein
MNIRELLERAGFGIRSAKRADCAHCTGRSRGTVSYTERVAYCHRCGWRANDVRLARELGLGPCSGGLQAVPANGGRAKALPLQDPQARREREARIAAFAAWRNAKVDELVARSHRLQFRADLANLMLADEQESVVAWQALADYYHERAQLEATLDFLLYTKLSVWLDGSWKSPARRSRSSSSIR